MWGMSKKREESKQNNIEEYINLFATRNHSGFDSTKIVQIDNIRFTILRSYENSIKIHLIDGDDELLVYTGDYVGTKKSTWHHKGSWCDKILQIVRGDYEQKQRIEQAKEQAKIDEENRLKDKFEKLFAVTEDDN